MKRRIDPGGRECPVRHSHSGILAVGSFDSDQHRFRIDRPDDHQPTDLGQRGYLFDPMLVGQIFGFHFIKEGAMSLFSHAEA